MLSSREDLIDYCMHQLGAPVINIEIDEMQVNYCIDNAIDRWRSVHCDGSVRRFVPHTITQSDIDKGYITVPDRVISIVRVLPTTYGTLNTNIDGMGMFNPVYQYHLNDMWDLTRGGMSAFHDVMTYLQTIECVLIPDTTISFNRYSNRLYLEADLVNPVQYKVGMIIVVECFVMLDDIAAPMMYNDWWLKQYATALIKKQWGANTKKYDGVQLPGGVTMQGSVYYNEAVQEIRELEERLVDEFTLPPIFMVG